MIVLMRVGLTDEGHKKEAEGIGKNDRKRVTGVKRYDGFGEKKVKQEIKTDELLMRNTTSKVCITFWKLVSVRGLARLMARETEKDYKKAEHNSSIHHSLNAYFFSQYM